jgi:hypothetical protein
MAAEPRVTFEKSEANCQVFALQWRDRVEAVAAEAKREIGQPDQLDRSGVPGSERSSTSPSSAQLLCGW